MGVLDLMKSNIWIFLVSIMLLNKSSANITFPDDGMQLHYTHVMFRWDQEPDATNYNLVVFDQSDNTTLNIQTSHTVYIDKNNFEWDKTYHATVTPILDIGLNFEWSDTISFSIGSAFTSADLNTEIMDSASIQDGLVLFSQISPDFSMVIIDNLGNQVWNSEFVYVNHWNQYGQLFGMQNGIGVEVNFYDEIIWETPIGTEIDAHEIKQISNGNYMGIVPEYQSGPIPIGPWTSSYQDLGYIGDGETNEFTWRGTKIVEWDDLSTEEIWSWSPFDHFDMNDYDSLEGRWWSPINGSSYGMVFDWNHVNAFHFDETESAVYISSRNLSRITKVSYPDYNLVWNMGPPNEFGYGDENICTDLLFSCQHHIQKLENDDLLFFDNGKLSEIFLDDSFPTTRIRRVRVIDNAYCETIWEYELPQELYGHSWGSVQLLENGNYFIYTHGSGYQDGSICTLMEVTPEQELVWSANHTIPFSVWYRGYKIPSIHPGAFSVDIDRYQTIQTDTSTIAGIVVDENNHSLIFTISNHSGYDQPYSYTLNDESGWYPFISDTVFIEAGEDHTISLSPTVLGITSTTIELSVKPNYHRWSRLDLTYNVFHISGVLSQSDKIIIPDLFRLFQNYPNPFNPTTTLKYFIGQDADVKVIIHDLLGNVIKDLFIGKELSGYKSIQWDGMNDNGILVPGGVYLYTIQAGKESRTKKMILLK